MAATSDVEIRYAGFLAKWGDYVKDGYGEEPSQDDYAEALASLVVSDPMTVYRGMAVHPGWTSELHEGSPLGNTWTMERSTAATYAGAPGGGAVFKEGHVAVLLVGSVALSDVEIDETVANYLVAGEAEVTLSEGARIRLDAVEGLEVDPDLLGIEYPAGSGGDPTPAP